MQIIFKLPISMTTGYNYAYTTHKILYRPDKNFGWIQQRLKLHQESNSFFSRKHTLKSFKVTVYVNTYMSWETKWF